MRRRPRAQGGAGGHRHARVRSNGSAHRHHRGAGDQPCALQRDGGAGRVRSCASREASPQWPRFGRWADHRRDGRAQ